MRNISGRKKCLHLKVAEEEEEDGEVVLEEVQTDGSDLLKGNFYFLFLAPLWQQIKQQKYITTTSRISWKESFQS